MSLIILLKFCGEGFCNSPEVKAIDSIDWKVKLVAIKPESRLDKDSGPKKEVGQLANQLEKPIGSQCGFRPNKAKVVMNNQENRKSNLKREKNTSNKPK